MGNSVSCFDPVREHPPYSWPKDHPGRQEAIDQRRRARKNQKIVGSQGNARTIAKDPSVPITAPPLEDVGKEAEEKKALLTDDQAANVEDASLKVDDHNVADDVQEKVDDKETAVVAAATAAAAVEQDDEQIQDEVKDKDLDVAAIAVTDKQRESIVDEENTQEVEGIEETKDLDDQVDAAAVVVADAGEEEDEEQAKLSENVNDQVMDQDIGIEATPVDENDTIVDDSIVEQVDDGIPVVPTSDDVVKETETVIESATNIDERRAMFDKADDELPEVKELRRDVFDPVTKEYVSLEEYRKRQREQAQGVVKERVEKFEEIDDERSRQLAEHAAIEAARAEAIANAEWRFKHKDRQSTSTNPNDPDDYIVEDVIVEDQLNEDVLLEQTENVPATTPLPASIENELVHKSTAEIIENVEPIEDETPIIQQQTTTTTSTAQSNSAQNADLLAGLLPTEEEKEQNQVADKIPELQNVSSPTTTITEEGQPIAPSS